MKVLLASAGGERFALPMLQVSQVLPWPLDADLPWGSLCALLGLPDGEPEPRAVIGRSAASGAPFALRVPGSLLEVDVPEPAVLPIPPLLFAPRWVQGLVLAGEPPALLLDLPPLGDLVLAAAQAPATLSLEPRT